MTSVVYLTSTADKVVRELLSSKVTSRGSHFIPIDIDDENNKYSLSIDKNGNEIIDFGKFSNKVKEKFTVWNRHINCTKNKFFHRNLKERHKDDQTAEFIFSEYNSLLLNLRECLSNSFWVNTVAGEISSSSKINNIAIANRLGLNTPPTIVSNDKNKIIKFIQTYESDFAIKPFNSFEIQCDNKLFHCVTAKVNKTQIYNRIDSIKIAPVFIQQYLEKSLELRITVVGKRVFSVAIYSQEHEKSKYDWRCAPLDELRYEPYLLPNNIEKALINFNHIHGLKFSTFDFIKTPEGKFYFLECNSDGEWYWLEKATSLKISDSLTDLLVNQSYE